MSTILLVEDNPHIMKINAEALTMYGYEVLRAATAAECRDAMRWHPVDLVVLDIMLPDGNGVELCRELKESYHVPILFLSALGESRDVVEGLRAGGDDYLAKPYDLEVLAARIDARLRQERAKSRYVSYGNLRLDTLSCCGYLGDTDLLLTQKEFAAAPAGPQRGGVRVQAEGPPGGVEHRNGGRQPRPVDPDLPAAPEAQQRALPHRNILQAGGWLYPGANLNALRRTLQFCKVRRLRCFDDILFLLSYAPRRNEHFPRGAR